MRNLITIVFTLGILSIGFCQSRSSVITYDQKNDKLHSPKYNRFFAEEGYKWILDSNSVYHPFNASKTPDCMYLETLSIIERNAKGFPMMLIGTNNYFETDTNDTLGYEITIKENAYFPQKETEWLMDSIFRYTNHTEINSIITSFSKITERTSNGLPLVLEEYIYDTQLDQYIVKFKETLEYPDQNNSNIFTQYFYSTGYETGLDEPFSKISYNNDENGLIITITEELYENAWYGNKEVEYLNETENYYERYIRRSENEEWVFLQKGHRYDDMLNECIISYNMEYLDTVSKSYEYYNSTGFTSLSEDFSKDDDNSWYKSAIVDYEYNDNNELIGYNTFSFIENEWIHQDSSGFSYDDYGYLNSITYLQWEQSGYWEFSEKLEYVNDSLGNILVVYEFDDINNSSWEEFMKIEYTYDQNSHIILEAASLYDPEVESYNFQWKEELEYENDLLLSVIHYSWILEDSIWIPNASERTEYDEQSRKTIFTKELRDSTNQYWVPFNEIEYLYVENDIHKANHIIEQEYFEEEGYWEKVNEEIKYYNKHITKTNELPINTFKLYPNPSSEFIIIESDIYHSHKTTYEIFDMQGHIINSGNLSPDGMIKINKLTNGQYFVKVYNPEGKALTFVKN